MSKAFAVFYLAAVSALIAAAVGIWRMRCENFGCMGVGVAWMAWAALFVPTLVTGLLLRSSETLGAAMAKLVGVGLVAQVFGGLVLAGLWLSRMGR